MPRLQLVSLPADDLPPLDDAAWVARARSGDREACAALYARHAPAVRVLLARVLGGGPDVDDVLQDAFMTALRRLDSLRDPSALRPWLRSVALGCARHHLRSRARRRWLSFLEPARLAEEPAAASGPFAWPRDDGTRDAVRAARAVMATLPADERIAFALRHVEGASLEDAAALTGVSLATFKRRLLRAQRLFRERARAWPALDDYVGEEAP